MKNLKRITTAAALKQGLINMKKGYNKALAKIISINNQNGYVMYKINRLAKVYGQYNTELATTKNAQIIITKTYSKKTNKQGFLYVLKQYLGQNLINKTILVDILYKEDCFCILNTQLSQSNLMFLKQVNARNKRGINQHTKRNTEGLIVDCESKVFVITEDNEPFRILEHQNNQNTRIIENQNTIESNYSSSIDSNNQMETTFPPSEDILNNLDHVEDKVLSTQNEIQKDSIPTQNKQYSATVQTSTLPSDNAQSQQLEHAINKMREKLRISHPEYFHHRM